MKKNFAYQLTAISMSVLFLFSPLTVSAGQIASTSSNDFWYSNGYHHGGYIDISEHIKPIVVVSLLAAAQHLLGRNATNVSVNTFTGTVNGETRSVTFTQRGDVFWETSTSISGTSGQRHIFSINGR